MNTEITDNCAVSFNGWVLFDASCSLCTAWTRFFREILHRHGFAVVALQTPWVLKRLGIFEGEPLAEMRLLLTNGEAPGGADAIIEIARRIWWAWPFFLFANLPGVKPLLRAAYRFIAANRYCANGVCKPGKKLRWFDWLPLVLLTAAAIAFGNRMVSWAFMWALTGAIFIGCKWLTWRKAWLNGSRPRIGRSIVYFFAWPGMNAREFLAGSRFAPRMDCEHEPDRGRGGERGRTAIDAENGDAAHKVSKYQWPLAFAKALVGATLVWIAADGTFKTSLLVTGWIGMLGIILFLHFGIFEILALVWQRVGFNATPIMRAPLASTSLSEFWSGRWNTAFNILAHDLAFRPLANRFGVTRATLGVFVISGIIHDLVISLPAKGGYGLPTAYFVFQGVAVLVERSAIGRNIGLGRGIRGWLFTAACAGGPAFWLFHPWFVKNVILPMLQAIGGN